MSTEQLKPCGGGATYPLSETFTVHSASRNTETMSSANRAASSSPNFSKFTTDPRYGRREATNLSWSALLIRRWAKRCWSSNKAFSALAALVCCFAISPLAFAASVSRPATLESATAVRSCCSTSFVLASVKSFSNWRDCSSCCLPRIPPVMSAPAPNANVRNSRITVPQSNNDFHPSTVMHRILSDPFSCLLLVLGVLSVLCACALPVHLFYYGKGIQIRTLPGLKNIAAMDD